MRPHYFEEMGQNQGMALYRATLPAGDAAELTFDRIADYAQVWLDGQRIATVDRRLAKSPIAIPAHKKPSELEILVEAMGHINFGKGMKFDRKGIVGEVRLGGKAIENWRVAMNPLSEDAVLSAQAAKGDGYAGGHYRAVVRLDDVADTFIDMSKWTKGVLYVNGHNLGRYWNIGPQYSLYCPAPFLRKGDNQIDIIELEDTKPNPICGLTRPLVRAAAINTKNTSNVW